MMPPRYIFVVALIAFSVSANSALAAILTPIASPSGFKSTVKYVDNFDNGTANMPAASNSPFTYEPTSKVGLASLWTAGETSSGDKGLMESIDDSPMRIVFDMPVYEIGMYFGNDDFGKLFDATLELFNAADVSLGTVKVKSNGNDKADQFIGARSTVGAMSAKIYYQQPNATKLSVFIDDLTVSIPEPASLGLALCGLALASAARSSHRRRKL